MHTIFVCSEHVKMQQFALFIGRCRYTLNLFMNVVNSYFQDCKLVLTFERDRLWWLMMGVGTRLYVRILIIHF